MWCDVEGVYVRGWAHCDDERVTGLYLRCGDLVAAAEDRHARADVSAAYPALPYDDCGFTCYLACPPFRPVVLGISTAEATTEVALEGVVQTDVGEPQDDDDPFDRFIAEMKRIGGNVVEIGARAVSPGAVLQRDRFAPECTFTGVDVHAAPGVDVVADAHFLSSAIAPGSADGVFSLAVMEHLATPWLVAAEINRVLKVGGLTYHVVPHSWPLHELPNDFWRMSSEALRVLFGAATGFEVVLATMTTPIQMIPHASLRKPPYLDFPLARGMGLARVLARKVADIGAGAVSWPVSREDSALHGRRYPWRPPATNGTSSNGASSNGAASNGTASNGVAHDGAAEPAVDLVAVIRSSPLFDGDWYLAHNPDVAAAGTDAAEHYLHHGGFEERDPGPHFNSAFYLQSNPDVRRHGMNPLLHYVLHGRAEGRAGANPHARWVRDCDRLDDLDRVAIRRHIAGLERHPLLSVVVPVYDTDPQHLAEMIASVKQQAYPYWELCIADDCSTDPAVARILRAAAAGDRRIKLAFRTRNGHISAATNSALALATGEFVCLLDHDDLLHENALYELAVELDAHPDADLVYSDSDQIDEEGCPYQPYFKTDWNYDLMLGQNMISHLGAYRRALVEQVGGMRTGFEGSQDYDLALRVADATAPERIRHIPAILYHWRRPAGAASFSALAPERCTTALRTAVADHLARRGIAARVEPARGAPHFSRVVYPLPPQPPLVTVAAIATGERDGADERLRDVLSRTAYDPVEIVVVHAERGALAQAKNRAVREARGDVVVLLDADLRADDPQWLSTLVSHALRPGVGLVGALVAGPDGAIADAGIVLNARAGHAAAHARGGHFGCFALTREVSAVSSACVAFRRAHYVEAGGLRDDVPLRRAEVELCLRVRDAGLRTIATADAELVRDTPRADDVGGDDAASPSCAEDPFYNPNLSLETLYHEPANPSRRVKPWARARRELEVREGQARRARSMLDGVPRTARILEVGPSYSPVAPRADGWRTTIVDHASRAELVEKYRLVPDVWVERIEDVDCIWSDGSLADAVPAALHGTFDVVIASHVIEHTPDPVAFLRAMETLLRDDGIVVLAVPDKRFCFDYFRPLATTAHLLEAHESGRVRHTRRTAYEHYAYAALSGGQGAWGQAPVADLALVHDFERAAGLFAAYDASADAPYADMHAWQFTPASFALILLELARLEMLDWAPETITPPEGCEFRARLRRGGIAQARALPPAELDARRLELLREIVRETGEQARYAPAGACGTIPA
jgi:glycosyltransferase involved in cell wall biosynthesis/2-polyprenyl-3-methyl-5-hydroxy-6-metoxy-1,4-benzoquinol methylase